MPFVISGSSPEYFFTAQKALLSLISGFSTWVLNSIPAGVSMLTDSIVFLVSAITADAFAAAAAQLPVVKPLFSIISP